MANVGIDLSSLVSSIVATEEQAVSPSIAAPASALAVETPETLPAAASTDCAFTLYWDIESSEFKMKPPLVVAADYGEVACTVPKTFSPGTTYCCHVKLSGGSWSSKVAPEDDIYECLSSDTNCHTWKVKLFSVPSSTDEPAFDEDVQFHTGAILVSATGSATGVSSMEYFTIYKGSDGYCCYRPTVYIRTVGPVSPGTGCTFNAGDSVWCIVTIPVKTTESCAKEVDTAYIKVELAKRHPDPPPLSANYTYYTILIGSISPNGEIHQLHTGTWTVEFEIPDGKSIMQWSKNSSAPPKLALYRFHCPEETAPLFDLRCPGNQDKGKYKLVVRYQDGGGVDPVVQYMPIGSLCIWDSVSFTGPEWDDPDNAPGRVGHMTLEFKDSKCADEGCDPVKFELPIYARDGGSGGSRGATGATGATGDPGKDGSRGSKGDPGNDGKDGSRGSKGDPGCPGEMYVDAYPEGDGTRVVFTSCVPTGRDDQGLCTYNCFETASAFIKNGSRGSRGSKGDPGNDGKDGSRGSRGSKGDPGNDGSRGSRGSKGDPGNDGCSVTGMRIDPIGGGCYNLVFTTSCGSELSDVICVPEGPAGPTGSVDYSYVDEKVRDVDNASLARFNTLMDIIYCIANATGTTSCLPSQS